MNKVPIITKMVHWSIGPTVHLSIGPRSIQLNICRSVPPVIFYYDDDDHDGYDDADCHHPD